MQCPPLGLSAHLQLHHRPGAPPSAPGTYHAQAGPRRSALARLPLHCFMCLRSQLDGPLRAPTLLALPVSDPPTVESAGSITPKEKAGAPRQPCTQIPVHTTSTSQTPSQLQGARVPTSDTIQKHIFNVHMVPRHLGTPSLTQPTPARSPRQGGPRAWGCRRAATHGLLPAHRKDHSLRARPVSGRVVPAPGSAWRTWRPLPLPPPCPYQSKALLPAGKRCGHRPSCSVAGLAHLAPHRRSSRAKEDEEMSQDRPSLF